MSAISHPGFGSKNCRKHFDRLKSGEAREAQNQELNRFNWG